MPLCSGYVIGNEDAIIECSLLIVKDTEYFIERVLFQIPDRGNLHSLLALSVNVYDTMELRI